MKKLKGVLVGIVSVGMVCSLSFADKKIYDAKCATCHGKDGKGKAAMAKMFKVSPSALDLTSTEVFGTKDEEFLKIIAKGKNKMPAYEKQLKSGEIESVLQYIRSFTVKK